jgi:hypothetical protein
MPVLIVVICNALCCWRISHGPLFFIIRDSRDELPGPSRRTVLRKNFQAIFSARGEEITRPVVATGLC